MKPVAYLSGIDSNIHRAKRVGGGLMGLSLMMLTGCLPSSRVQTPTETIASGNPAVENALRNPTPQDFSKPIIAQATLGKPAGSNANIPPLATVPVKGLMQATRSSDRTQQITTDSGRDPFAASPAADLQIPGLTQFGTPKTRQHAPVPLFVKPAPKSSQSQKPAVTNSRPQPQTSRRPMAPQSANLPTVPVQNNLPPIGTPIEFFPTAPLISPTNLADQVEITGVVQVGDRVMAIAKAPEESSARYVNSGDRLSGGRVIVREIRPGGSPTVVLEQNGHTVVKSIGANRVASVR